MEVRGWGSAKRLWHKDLGEGKGRGDLNREFAENTEISWNERRPGWSAEFKPNGSTIVNTCQG